MTTENTTQEKINQFKSDLRDYQGHYNKIQRCQLMISELKTKMENVSSPKMDSIYLPRGDTKTPKQVPFIQSNFTQLLVEKSKWELEMNTELFILEKVTKKLDGLAPIERKIITAIYINGESYPKVLRYVDRVTGSRITTTRGLQKWVRRIFEKIVINC